MSKLSKFITSIIMAAAFCALGLNTFTPLTPTFADDSICNNPHVDDQIKAASGCPSAGTSDDLPNVIVNIVNGIILVAGFVAVAFIVVGGIQYMTSAGDAGKTKKAKDTLLYAVIGLIICALSFAIVNFVIKSIIG